MEEVFFQPLRMDHQSFIINDRGEERNPKIKSWNNCRHGGNERSLLRC